MSYSLRFLQLGARAILIEWPQIIDPLILKDVLFFKTIIKINYIKQKVELNSGYSSILILYDSTIDDVNGEVFKLEQLYKQQNKDSKPVFRRWEIPVCYSDEFGSDMQDFSSIKKLSKAEIINLHTSTNYTVYFIGFLPGFLYLGGLNPKLFLDRKASPTRQVEKGSVGIGGQQTGIYPDQSPGGWHIIGKTPIELFNASKSPPCTINLGDEIRFKAISKDEYNQISLSIKASNFKIKSELIYD